MSWFYENVIRPSLFSYDSEQIHDATLTGLGRLSGSRLGLDMLASFYEAPRLPVRAFGLDFPNPIGLAAGMDKQAAAVPAWEAMGFGFCELGGVTWHEQPGNPAPRMFRAVSDQALVNRMGFNNPGAPALAKRLAQWRASGLWPKHPVGINLGKSKVTPLDQAAEDYRQSLGALWSLADFFVVNVSSPNTPNLRQLQDRAALDEVIAAVQSENERQAGASGRMKPVLVKVAPDLTFTALDEVLDVAARHALAGIVATNTTIERPATTDEQARRAYSETGGLSGAPLRARSTEVIRHIHARTAGRLPIIGVGGIFTVADAQEKLEAGATLLQVYTALVYKGPSIAREIVSGLIELGEAQGRGRSGAVPSIQSPLPSH